MARCYGRLGQIENDVQEENEAVQLYPSAIFFNNLALAYQRVNRFEEAEETCNRAISLGFDTSDLRATKYRLAVIRGDAAGMEQQIKWLEGKPEAYVINLWQGNSEAFSGQLKKAADSFSRYFELSRQGSALATLALVNALAGNCDQVVERTAKALSLTKNPVSAPWGYSIMALLSCRKVEIAQSLMREIKGLGPSDTLTQKIYLPFLASWAAVLNGNHRQAVDTLQPVRPYERVMSHLVMYARGLAYLGLGDGKAASAEFGKILNNRGLDPLGVFYPLAYLQLGRAAKLEGDVARSRKAYQDFFAIWKNADPDIPILKEAKAEYAKLQ